MKIVFFDDQRLGGRVNTKRAYGTPKLVNEYKEEMVSPLLPRAFADGKIAPYVMYYTARFVLEKPVDNKSKPKTTHCLCMAVSDDCIHWKPYPNDLQFENKYLPHQILPADEYVEVIAVIKDNDGIYRFFACYVDWERIALRGVAYASKDGVTLYEDGNAIQGGEPYTGLFYNHKKDCYTFIIRPNWGERRCCISETKDFKTYTPLRVMLQADSMDRPMTEIYGMPTFNMDDYFVGLVDTYDATIYSTRQKYEKGHMSVQLAYSFDGVHFQRSLREDFISRGTPDSPYYGMLAPYSITERKDKGDMIITAFGSVFEHACTRGMQLNSLLSFVLKKDRFIGLESDGGDAIVCTRMLFWKGGELSINIQVPYGEARVRITDEYMKDIDGYSFDDCIPFTGDSLAWTPQWKNAKLDDLKGKYFLAEIKFYNGTIYAIEGNYDLLMTTMQAHKTQNLGMPIPELLY